MVFTAVDDRTDLEVRKSFQGSNFGGRHHRVRPLHGFLYSPKFRQQSALECSHRGKLRPPVRGGTAALDGLFLTRLLARALGCGACRVTPSFAVADFD